MSKPAQDWVAEVFRQPERVPGLSPSQWDLLLRQARSAGLLARLACQLETLGLLARVPDGPAGHLEAAMRVAQAQRVEIEREITHVRRALQPLGVPIVLLKGAAYVAAGLPAARGRVFSDTDILVPKARISDVESALMRNGWTTTHLTAYDQRYYRQWMHELPPLVHLRRQTALDVHHAIAPETARIRPDSGKLLSAAVAIPGADGFCMLAPPDMVLHSMLHLLVNDELSHGLRDLSDLDLLLRHFGAKAEFWAGLNARALELGLGRTLYYGTQCVSRILGTPIPESVAAGAAASAPGPLLDATMSALYRRGLRTPHPSTADWATPAALFALYVRAHWMRMPPALLARHLTIKALRLSSAPSVAKTVNP